MRKRKSVSPGTSGRLKKNGKPGKSRKPGRGPLTAAARYLTARTNPAHSRRSQKLNMQLRVLYPGDPDAVENYYVNRTAGLLRIICLLALICIPAAFFTRGGTQPVNGQGLKRPGYGQGTDSAVLCVEAEWESEPALLENIEVEIGSRKYTREQAEEFLLQARDELDEIMLGENPSEDEVRLPLVLPGSLCGGRVRAQYLTVPYGYISENGQIEKDVDETGQIVEIRATLTCQEESIVCEKAVLLLPPVLDEASEFRADVEAEIAQADRDSASEPYLKLPQQAGGKQLRWMVSREGQSRFFAALLVILPALLFVRSGQKVDEKARARERELGQDYGLLMWKLTMLLGAGLTVHDAFFRIAGRAEKGSRTGGGQAERYVYREMRYTCMQIQRGVSEAQAYEQFGRRCGLPQYVRLGTMLSQSLRKGTKGLAQTLEKEMENAMTDRRDRARKLGEEAGTRLLFPMVLMLGVVLAVLIVPAFMSM